MRWLAALLFLVCASPAFSAMQTPECLDSTARAKMSIGCCFDESPPKGYAPIDVTIDNFSGATQSWTLDFSNPGYSGYGSEISSRFQVSVENNATRTIPLLVPLWKGDMPTQIGVKIQGYGADNVQQYIGSGSRSNPSRFVAISNSLGTALWSTLEARVKQATSTKFALDGSLFDPAALPEDWRGLSGVSGVWLKGSELDQLSPAQRGALRDWVRMGGALKLCNGNAGVPADFLPLGFGKAESLPATLDVGQLTETIRTQFTGGAAQLPTPAWNGGNSRKFEPVAPNVPLLIGFMVVFGGVVGPFNIFVLAGERRRQRLLWTTPLISVAASLLLMGVILLKDGAGGRGERAAIVCVVPREHSEIVCQEQLSRTGLLFNSSFQTKEAAFIDPTEDGGNNRKLQNEGVSFRGEWFASRAVQTQQIGAVVPTRAELTVLNAPDVQAGKAAPVVLSSFGATLDTLRYIDAQHRRWRGENIRTGEKTTLVEARPASNKSNDSKDDTETFRATARDSSAFVDTLPSIRWTDEPVTYFGPVTLP